MTDILLEKSDIVLAKVLDGAAARQRVLANNIANVETPNFQRKAVSFEGELREAMDAPTIDPDMQLNAIRNVATEAAPDTNTPARANGNNVQIDREMVELAKNSLQYETAAQLLTMELREVQNAIHEGRR